MRRTGFVAAALFAVALALVPGLAFARAGGGASMGSRGSFTYSAPPATRTAPMTAAPMQRSLTPQGSPAAPAYGQPGYGQPGYGQPGYGGFGRPSFMSGLFGGLIGAGIGGMLFGGGLFHGITGFGGFLGFLIQIFLIVMVVRFLIRRFMPGASPAMAGGGMFSRMGMGAGMSNQISGGGAAGYGAPPPLTITPADYQAFEQNLKAVQGAWSAQNITALQQLATPEMVSYFGEQLAEQSSRGVHNVITDVTLDQGDLSQAWSEGGRDYATVAMKFSMIDVTTDMAGRVVDGDPRSRVQATELWTFLRAPGGRWVLSAIQQAS